MPDSNGNRTIHEWLRHIDGKLDHIRDKLDAKTDKGDHDRLENRVDGIDQKHHNLSIKVAGIAGGISLVIILAGWLIGK